MTLPNFLLIGATKSGTSSLHDYLRQHPDIYMPATREQKFFAIAGQEISRPQSVRDTNLGANITTRLRDYEALFHRVDDEVAIGENSNAYLWSVKAPERIKHHIPNVKILAILRHPADRAYSDFLMNHRNGLCQFATFEDAIDAERTKLTEHWALWLPFFVRGGNYFDHLSRYYQHFPQSRIGVFLLDDLRRNPQVIMQKVYSFLGVESSFVPDFRRRNAGWVARNDQVDLMMSRLIGGWQGIQRGLEPVRSHIPDRWKGKLCIGKALNRVRTWNHKRPPQMSHETRYRLVEYYRDDILRLQCLIDRDLSMWMTT